jgi:hypothetical protein
MVGRRAGARPGVTGASRPDRVFGRAGTILRGLVHGRTAVLCIVWVALAGTWITTCAQLGLAGDWHFALLAAADLALLVILYLAEGMELAVTDLLDKDPEQVGDASVRAVLREIQGDQGFFYANRQVFVVVVIAFMSQTTTYPWIFVPGVGRVSGAGAPAWFGFLLTTLTVLWFAQVTPKRLAIVNSELFLKQSRFVWMLIRMVGALGLPTPTDVMEAVARRYTSYREHRALLPSRAMLYSIQTRLRGYALDRLSISLRVGQRGATTVRKRFLVLLLHGPHWEMYGSIETPVGLRGAPRVRVLGLYRTTAPERIDGLAPELDAIFDGRTSEPDSRLTPIPLDDWKHEVVVEQREPSLDGRSTAYWVIRGECLPESYQESHEATSGGPRTMVALLYEADATYGPGAVEPETSWSEAIELPCRLLTIEAATDANAKAAVVATSVTAVHTQPRTELVEEGTRLSRQLLANRGAARITYPMLGVTYGLHWTTVRRGR